MRIPFSLVATAFLYLLEAKAGNAQSGKSAYDACRSAILIPDRIHLCSLALQTTTDRQLRERILLRRGNSLQEGERHQEAIRDYTDLIRINPRIAGYYDNRKSAFQALGRYAEALVDANTAVSIAPTHAFVFRSRALLFEDMQQYEAAITDFDRAISMSANDVGLLVDRARLKVRGGRAAEAIRELSAIIGVEPGNQQAYRERGFAYISLGDMESAAFDLARVAPGDEVVARALADIAARGARR